MLVEILVHYGLFDALRAKLPILNINDKQQFLLIMLITFFMTALLDTVAVAIAMIQIARRFFKGKNLLIAAAAIIVATSAGGAWSPLGNVTTILLWLADKFTVTEVIQYAFCRHLLCLLRLSDFYIESSTGCMVGAGEL